jgi:hypothetical protein
MGAKEQLLKQTILNLTADGVHPHNMGKSIDNSLCRLTSTILDKYKPDADEYKFGDIRTDGTKVEFYDGKKWLDYSDFDIAIDIVAMVLVTNGFNDLEISALLKTISLGKHDDNETN